MKPKSVYMKSKKNLGKCKGVSKRQSSSNAKWKISPIVQIKESHDKVTWDVKNVKKPGSKSETQISKVKRKKSFLVKRKARNSPAGEKLTRKQISNKEKKSDKVEDELKEGTLPRLDVQEKFLWLDAAQYYQQPANNVSSDDGDEVEEEKQISTKRKRVNKFREQKKEENVLYKTEKMLMDEDRVPQSADEFDRAVLASPNNSLVWMQYMAFHLQSVEIDKSRAVAERALKLIGFREEQEKLNVWVALLNLENLYGTKESLKAVLARALQYNDTFKVYTSMAKIYLETSKLDEAEMIHKIIVKKFNSEQEAWIGAGTFFMRAGQHQKARDLMERSFKNMDKRFHVDVICKFAHLEFLHGDPERAKSMFENVLGNYPKRTDKWAMYLDILIKLGNLDDVRNVFERILKVKMTVRKMTVFFKKYLNFEMKFGNESSVESVRMKAKEFVDSREMMEM